jgi:hypothetical protein
MTASKRYARTDHASLVPPGTSPDTGGRLLLEAR